MMIDNIVEYFYKIVDYFYKFWDNIVEYFYNFLTNIGWIFNSVSSALAYVLERPHLEYVYYLTTPVLVLLGSIALLISIHQSNQAKHARLADTLIQFSEKWDDLANYRKIIAYFETIPNGNKELFDIINETQ